MGVKKIVGVYVYISAVLAGVATWFLQLQGNPTQVKCVYFALLSLDVCIFLKHPGDIRAETLRT